MSFASKTNTATASVTVNGVDLTKSSSADFVVANALEIVITKIVDRAPNPQPGDIPPLYYNGETITFTITMSRVTGMQSAINNITLKDLVPTVVSYTLAGVTISGTHGNVTIGADNSLTIENLVLNNGNPTNVITITGTIVYP